MVYFVGAGPGDEGLVTVKGAEKIKTCDILIYDRLIGKGLIKLAKPCCEKIYVGKQAGIHYKKQEEINQLLLEKALTGKTVVRLKGGDSFVFGRGTEEIDELNKYNIPYKVIPGVTAATAVPECAGIPVTHRGVSRGFHVITGHTNTSTGASDCNYKALAGVGGTLVFMMGLANIKEIADNLIGAGMPAGMPAAVISDGTTESQHVLRSQLGCIAEDVRKENIKTPAVIIIGKTAGYKYIYNAPGTQIKAGIIATKELREKTCGMLESAGVTCIPLCDMEIIPAPGIQNLYGELKNIEKYNWIVFTSRNGVRIFFGAMKRENIDIRRLSGIRFAVTGDGTADKLKGYGINADFIPEKYTSGDLAKGLSGLILPEENVLIPRAVQGSRELADIFARENINYKELRIYDVRGRLMDGMEKLAQTNYIIFLSASGVREFLRLLKEDGREIPPGIKFICIGPAAGKELKKYNTSNKIITSGKYNIEGILKVLMEECRLKTEWSGS